jgi:hypothetical protein
MVEFSIVALFLFSLVGGLIDFSLAFFQWNAASRAMQAGVRVASVSDPVARGIEDWQFAALVPGDPMPSFTVTCQAGACLCTGTCPSNPTYNSQAMTRIINGRNLQCGGAAEPTGLPGMCDVYWRIQPQNVIVRYSQGTSLGFAGRPGGPVPTITIELTGLQYDFIFLRNLIPSRFMTMPAMSTSATGEDLRACGEDACP